MTQNASVDLTPGKPVPAPDSPPSAPRQLYALKHHDTFLVADAAGDITGEADGLFRNDTRVLSRFRLTIGGGMPSLLSAAISRDNVFFTSHVTNRPLPPLGGRSIPEGVIHVERTRFLWEERLYERIGLTNYGVREIALPISLEFDADFSDLFEVRGLVRAHRGQLLPPTSGESHVLLRYAGLDDVIRACCVAFSRIPVRLSPTCADFVVHLAERECIELYLEVGPDHVAPPSRERFRAAAARARGAMRTLRHHGAKMHSSERLFNEWVEMSRSDLALLVTDLPTGPYPYAGIPWFSTTFGRDAIITALQTLWLDPSLAHGVLNFLAHHQARERSAFHASAPGKILHETRRGEMTALGELPFGRYYGSVDTTPLFVMLAGAYAERTGDLAFIEELWPALIAAMAWIDEDGDSNNDGFLDYSRRDQGNGLINQGWKDSADSIFHADGTFPEGPVALIEVQGYVHAARHAMAQLAERRGDARTSEYWRRRATSLRDAVEDRFWMEELGTYAIALDGNDRLCRVRASNVGHLLYTGLPTADRAHRVSEQLLSPRFNSGWGVRTLALGESRFNPMAYHNGSVWPHDTALCAAGIARYGNRNGVLRLINELFETATHFALRLPELFCGFTRAPGEPPVAYPVACLPQAWSSGAVFMMLQACLGLRIDGARRTIHLDHPVLPQDLDRLVLRGLVVGDAGVTLVLRRSGDGVAAVLEGTQRTGVRVVLGEG